MSIPSKSSQSATDVASVDANHARTQVRAENDEILGELYAVKAQMNREARYDVSVLLGEACAEQRNHERNVH